MPVHNEAGAIQAVLEELCREIGSRLPVHFIISEDGSTDDTREILTALTRRVPMTLLTSVERKGYSRAVHDALDRAAAPLILFLDSDGQYDPADFWKLFARRNGANVVVGWRVRRADSPARRALSRVFRVFHALLFRLPLHDPSCSFVLMRRAAVAPILRDMSALDQGFWWEFTARAARAGLTIDEVPVAHRPRRSGASHVYGLRDVPRLILPHLAGLWRIWRETRRR